MLGAQSDDPARHADVAADRLKGSYSRRPTSIIRFVHQRQVRELAEKAGVAASTINRFELGKVSPNHSTLAVLQRAMEVAGVIFLDGDAPGVRLRVPRTVVGGEGEEQPPTRSRARRSRQAGQEVVAVSAVA